MPSQTFTSVISYRIGAIFALVVSLMASVSPASATTSQTLVALPSSISVRTGSRCVITVTGGLSTGNWQWTFPANCLVENGTTNHPTVTPLYPATYSVSVTKLGDANYAQSNTVVVTIVANGPTMLSKAGTYQLTVPANTTAIKVKAWGAGGGGGNPFSNFYSAPGGGGGYASATYSVSAGQIVKVVVGQGGSYCSSSGASAVYQTNGFQIIGAGGGAGGEGSSNTANGTVGGAGGSVGAAAPDFSPDVRGGQGATGSAGGAGGINNNDSNLTGWDGTGPANVAGGTPISSLANGGIGSPWGGTGCGGGGYFGGGGGAWDDVTGCQAGGGGGSNYVDTNPAHGYVASTFASLSGNGTVPANIADPDYATNAGCGTMTLVGTDGCVSIDWNPPAPPSTTTPADTMAPTVPTALNYADTSATSITLVWRAATDNVGVTGYLVYRGTQLLGSTTDLTFTDNNLTPSTAYSYTIKAQDAAGNVSAASSPLNVSTTQDFSADADHDGIPDASETALGTSASSAATSDSSNQTQQNIHRPTL